MIGKWADAGWPLALICVAIFYLSGFYTFGRFYQGRYKALIVFQAVCQSYLIYGFVNYGFSAARSTLPTSALIMSWGISLVLLIGSRLWLHIWTKIVDPERERMLGDGTRQRPAHARDRRCRVHWLRTVAKIAECRSSGARCSTCCCLIRSPSARSLGIPIWKSFRAIFATWAKLWKRCRDIDSVVHLGAIVGDPACELDRELTTEVNLSATRMVAEVAKLCGRRAVRVCQHLFGVWGLR